MVNAFASGTPRSTEAVLVLDGERYLIRQDGRGQVAWSSEIVTDQDVSAREEYPVRIADFSHGSGYSWQGPQGTYDYADGWDLSTPGKAVTWPLLASGEAFTTTDARGWQLFIGGYLYVARGRYVKKYVPDPTPGATWAVADTKDLGVGNVCGGRPAAFKGKGYFPVRVGAGGTAGVFQEVTPGGSDSWAAGPAGKESVCFRVWKNELVRANTNVVAKCATTPTTAGNWGAEYEVGETGSPITDLVIWNRFLLVGKTNGRYSFDESLNVTNDLADLEAVVDDNNFLGMEGAQGAIISPHKLGLIRELPGATYGFIGGEAEGGLDGALSKGWGRPSGVAPFGRCIYVTYNDLLNTRASLISLNPVGGRESQTFTPHVHQVSEGAYYDSVIVLSVASSPSAVEEAATGADDSAVGTVAWTNPSNALVSDDAYATMGTVATSHYLKVTGFNLNVPASATVTGITVYVERSADGP